MWKRPEMVLFATLFLAEGCIDAPKIPDAPTETTVHHDGTIENVVRTDTNVRTSIEILPQWLRESACYHGDKGTSLPGEEGAPASLLRWCESGGLNWTGGGEDATSIVLPPNLCLNMVNTIRDEDCPEQGPLPVTRGTCAEPGLFVNYACFCGDADWLDDGVPEGWLRCDAERLTWSQCEQCTQEEVEEETQEATREDGVAANNEEG